MEVRPWAPLLLAAALLAAGSAAMLALPEPAGRGLADSLHDSAVASAAAGPGGHAYAKLRDSEEGIEGTVAPMASVNSDHADGSSSASSGARTGAAAFIADRGGGGDAPDASSGGAASRVPVFLLPGGLARGAQARAAAAAGMLIIADTGASTPPVLVGSRPGDRLSLDGVDAPPQQRSRSRH